MNIMQKLRGRPGSGESSTESSAPETESPHTQLGLMHLKKLFNEYSHPKEPFTESERDFKLYNMLPLFCKVSTLGVLIGSLMSFINDVMS